MSLLHSEPPAAEQWFLHFRRHLLRRITTLAHAAMMVVLSQVAYAQPADAEPTSRPNIVLIMADDMGFSDIGCYGGEVQTPNLNALAADGLRFTQFYNTARCCPTRAALMTGVYPHQAGVGHMMGDDELPGYRGDLSRNCLTIPEALRRGGYRTAMSGKWHVTKQVGEWDDGPLTSRHNWPVQRGFEQFFGTIHGGGSFFDPVSLTRDNTPIEPEGNGFYYTDAISDNAVKFVEDYGRGEDPFFLYIAYTSPHWPLHALDEDIVKYHGRYDAGWDALRRERHRRMIDMGIVDAGWPLTERDAQVESWESAKNKAWHARRMEVYAAQIDRMDQGIGRIVDAVRRVAALENTLILFLADNGGCAEEIRARWGGLHITRETRDGRPVRVGNNPAVMPGPEDTYQSYGLPWANASNTPFRLYKHWVHEGGISTPLIAHWPAVIARRGELTGQPGHLIDIMATCLDVAGVEVPGELGGRKLTPVVGRSLLPIFEGRQRAGHEAIFWEHEGNRAVRSGKWKIVSKYPGSWELYDLQADRTELNDLAAESPDKVRELEQKYNEWAARSQIIPWNEILEMRRERRQAAQSGSGK